MFMKRILIFLVLFITSCINKNHVEYGDGIILAYEIAEPSKIYIHSINDNKNYAIETSKDRKDIFLKLNDTIRLRYDMNSDNIINISVLDTILFQKNPTDDTDKIIGLKEYSTVKMNY